MYKRLVYELQIAQDVAAYQASQALGSYFQIVVTARSGHGLAELEHVVQSELDRIKVEPPAAREVGRAVNQYEASFLRRLESISNKSDQLNGYYTLTGNPDYFNEDLSRYKAIDPPDICSVARTYLPDNARVVLSVVPLGKKELAATGGKEGK